MQALAGIRGRIDCDPVVKEEFEYLLVDASTRKDPKTIAICSSLDDVLLEIQTLCEEEMGSLISAIQPTIASRRSYLDAVMESESAR